MNGKLIPIIIVLLMVIGSFGAIGTTSNDKDCECGSTPISFSSSLGDGNYSKGLNPDFSPIDPQNVDNCTPRIEDFPDVFDWNNPELNYLQRDCVSPVKDQGQCGSCWAFATVAPMESKIIIQEGKVVGLSEQYLVSCNTDNWGCDGGWWGHEYHMNKDGAGGKEPGARSDDYGYTANDDPCEEHDPIYKIDNFKYVQGKRVPDTDNLKQAIYDHGPVSAAVAVGSSFQSYSGGTFKNDESGVGINHGVTIVGWNDNDECWIIKNSWDDDWGEQSNGGDYGEGGFMRIGYDTSLIGYAACYVGNIIPLAPPDDDGKILFTIDVDEILNTEKMDQIDKDPVPVVMPYSTIEPEWYYDVIVDSMTSDNQEISSEAKRRTNQNIGDDGEWVTDRIWDLDGEEKGKHVFEVDSREIEFFVKVMDADTWKEWFLDDLADVTPYGEGESGDGGVDQSVPDKRKAMYYAKYDIVTDKLIDEDKEGTIDGEWIEITTRGKGDTTINDAKVRFRIKDSYDAIESAEIHCTSSEGEAHGKTVIVGQASFSGSVVGGKPSFTWEWDFDEDGIVDSNIQSPSHTFSTGNYRINLDVSDIYTSASAQMDIHVTERPSNIQIEFKNDLKRYFRVKAVDDDNTMDIGVDWDRDGTVDEWDTDVTTGTYSEYFDSKDKTDGKVDVVVKDYWGVTNTKTGIQSEVENSAKSSNIPLMQKLSFALELLPELLQNLIYRLSTAPILIK